MYTIGFAGLTDSEHRVLYIGIAVLLAVIVFGMAAWLRRRYIPEDDPGNDIEDGTGK